MHWSEKSGVLYHTHYWYTIKYYYLGATSNLGLK